VILTLKDKPRDMVKYVKILLFKSGKDLGSSE